MARSSLSLLDHARSCELVARLRRSSSPSPPSAERVDDRSAPDTPRAGLPRLRPSLSRTLSAAASGGCTTSRSRSRGHGHEVTYLTMQHWGRPAAGARGRRDRRSRPRGDGSTAEERRIARPAAPVRPRGRALPTPARLPASTSSTPRRSRTSPCSRRGHPPARGLPPRGRLVRGLDAARTGAATRDNWSARSAGSSSARCVRLRHEAFCISRHTERRLAPGGIPTALHAVLPGLYAGPGPAVPCLDVEHRRRLRRPPRAREAAAAARGGVRRGARELPVARLELYGDGPDRQRTRRRRPAHGWSCGRVPRPPPPGRRSSAPSRARPASRPPPSERAMG